MFCRKYFEQLKEKQIWLKVTHLPRNAPGRFALIPKEALYLGGGKL